MIGFPSIKAEHRFDFLKPQLRDDESATVAFTHRLHVQR